MSKYEPLWIYFKDKSDKLIKLTYDDVKKITGFDIDHSFLTFKKELLEYGYQVKKISMKGKTILFEKI